MERLKVSLRENGYAVIDGFLDETKLRQMRDEAEERVRLAINAFNRPTGEE